MKDAASTYRWVVLALALIAQTSSSFVLQAPSPLAPLFQAELGLTKAEVGVLSASTSVGAWCVVLISGLLVDRFGIRRIMSLGLVATGSLLLSMSLTTSFIQAIAVMFAAGIARGAVFPSSTKAVLEWFPLRTRATAMGVKQMGLPLSGVAAASILPVLGLALGWRTAIAVPGLLIVFVGVATAILYRDSTDSSRMASGGVGFREALVELLRNRRLLVLCCVGFAFLIVQLPILAYLGLYFNDVVLVSSVPDGAARLVVAGGYLAVLQMGGALGRVSWGMVSDRLFGGRRMVVLAIIGGLSALVLLVVQGLGQEDPLWWLTTVVFLCGMMAVGWNGVYNALLTETVGRKYAATGVGLSMTVTEVGTIAGPPLFGFVADVSGSYRTAWLFLVVIAVAGALVAAAAARGERRARG
ncbi:MAG: MFS transporter [Sphingomonadaceae bacterium]